MSSVAAPPSPARASPGRPARWPRRPAPRTLLLLAPALALAFAAWQLRWVNEDGFIYFRVVDNLLHGRGPVFNAPERVESYTGPAWLALLAVLHGALPFVGLEHLAVALGVLLSATGLAMGTLGARRLLAPPKGSHVVTASAGGDPDVRPNARPHDAPPNGRSADVPPAPGFLVLPLGAVVVAALPPFWDFATAGLELGLALAWLGGAFLWLAASTERLRRPAALAALIGLGPLVRPDLGLFALGFLAALLWLARPLTARRAAGLLVAAAAVPVAYQVFRMGYFATLLPTTALAKEAGEALWGRGWDYLRNFVGPHALWLPLALLAVAWAGLGRALRRAGLRRELVVAAVPVACGLAHALYVVRLGGDYMHARMLLPSLFGGLLPVMAVAVPRRRAAVAAVVALGGWAALSAAVLRAPANPHPPDNPVARFLDQRRKQLTWPGHPHPVTLRDHLGLPYSQPYAGLVLRALTLGDPGSLVFDARPTTFSVDGHRVPVLAPVPDPVLHARAPYRDRVFAWTGSIGRAGYAAGPRVWFVDRFGLADPIGGRLRIEGPRRARAGHEKDLPLPWMLARFADPATVAADPRVAPLRGQVAAARAALRCGPLRDVLAGVDAPLTPGRFLRNLGVAWRTRSLRVAPDPVTAQRELCRRR